MVSGMDEHYTQQYERFEKEHWWFVVRRKIIIQFLGGAGLNPSSRWLDVGCGTGVLLSSLPQISDKMGVEMHAGSVAAGRAKGLRIENTGLSRDFRSFGPFDLITLCDVLEHVEDDQTAVEHVRLALTDHGFVLVTAPALMSLWSEHDVVNHHFRRYRRNNLLSLFPPDRWEILRTSYFSSLLLPGIWLSRVWRRWRKKAASPSGDLKFGPPWMDASLQFVFCIEKLLLRSVSLPLGSSIILVARKRPCRGT